MILTITIVIFLAILIITHEFGHFITAKIFKLRVDEFAFGFPPKIFSKKVGDTTYSLNAVPVGGFVKLYGENEEGADPNEKPERSFYAQPAWKRAVIIAAGVFINFLVGWLALSTVIFFVGVPTAVYIDKVAPNSPAAEVGLMKDQKIDGFKSMSDFISYVDANAGKTILVNGKSVTPRVNPPVGEGKLGVELIEGDYQKHDFIASIGGGFITSVQTVQGIYAKLGELVGGAFTGKNVLNSLSGPVGIFTVIKKASVEGILYLVQLLGILSLNLAVFNALPVPALDGGRLFFILLEKIIGRRLNIKYESIANLIGFSFLILLLITVTAHDIYRLIS